MRINFTCNQKSTIKSPPENSKVTNKVTEDFTKRSSWFISGNIIIKDWISHYTINVNFILEYEMVLTLWPISSIKTLQSLLRELCHNPWRIFKLELDTATSSCSSVTLLQIVITTQITQFVTNNTKTAQ